MIIKSTITGTASTPLMTALQNSAEIGLIEVKFSAMPIPADSASTAVERHRRPFGLRANPTGSAVPRRRHRRSPPPAPGSPIVRCPRCRVQISIRRMPGDRLSASAACAEVGCRFSREAWSVAAAVMMIDSAIKFENAMPTMVSARIRWNSFCAP